MNILPPPALLALSGARRTIDRIDDALLVLLAARRHVVSVIVPIKQHSGMPARDPDREMQVRRRAQRLARRLRVPDVTAQQLAEILIHDAWRQQGLASDLGQGTPAMEEGIIAPAMKP